MDCSSNVADENDDECAMIYPVADEVLIRRLFIDIMRQERREEGHPHNYQTATSRPATGTLCYCWCAEGDRHLMAFLGQHAERRSPLLNCKT